MHLCRVLRCSCCSAARSLAGATVPCDFDRRVRACSTSFVCFSLLQPETLLLPSCFSVTR
jgi:hypothetical protein